MVASSSLESWTNSGDTSSSRYDQSSPSRNPELDFVSLMRGDSSGAHSNATWGRGEDGNSEGTRGRNDGGRDSDGAHARNDGRSDHLDFGRNDPFTGLDHDLFPLAHSAPLEHGSIDGTT